MPMLIEHIDAIARKVQRGVLFIGFSPQPRIDCEDKKKLIDWKIRPIRKQVIDWLDLKSIGWQCCGNFANVNLSESYKGQIYVDVLFEQSNPSYQELTLFLEKSDGSMRYPDCTLYYCPLEHAMKNSQHDEPGFWERWADDF
jgi:hypothetical protein